MMGPSQRPQPGNMTWGLAWQESDEDDPFDSEGRPALMDIDHPHIREERDADFNDDDIPIFSFLRRTSRPRNETYVRAPFFAEPNRFPDS